MANLTALTKICFTEYLVMRRLSEIKIFDYCSTYALLVDQEPIYYIMDDNNYIIMTNSDPSSPSIKGVMQCTKG